MLRGHPGVPVTTNFMGIAQARRLLGVGAARGRRHPRLATQIRPIPTDHIESAHGLRPHALARQAAAVAAPGAGAERVNWRPNATKRPGLMRLGSCQAVAAVRTASCSSSGGIPGGGREVPQRDAPAWRDGGARLARDRPARARARGPRGDRGVDYPSPMSRSCSTGTTGGRSTAPTIRPQLLDLPAIVSVLVPALLRREHRRRHRSAPRATFGYASSSLQPVPAHREALEADRLRPRRRRLRLRLLQRGSSTRTTTSARRSRRPRCGGCWASGSTRSGRSPRGRPRVELSRR